MVLSSVSGPDPADMLRRLRARPVSSWAVAGRESVMRAALQRLAAMAAAAAGESARPVPDVGAVALPDQFAVLLADARASGVAGEVLTELLAELARGLGA